MWVLRGGKDEVYKNFKYAKSQGNFTFFAILAPELFFIKNKMSHRKLETSLHL